MDPSLAISLLARLRSGDPEAWRRLTALYGPEVYRWCRRAGLSAEDAADVGQEVFRAVVMKLESFRRDRPGDSFRGWLWAITRNKVRDHWRARGNGQAEAVGGTDAQLKLLEVAADETGDTSSAGSGRPGGPSALMRRALEMIRGEFEPKTWRAFWGVAVDGRAAAEVASEVGISAGAVYIAKSRVLRRLRDELGDLVLEPGE